MVRRLSAAVVGAGSALLPLVAFAEGMNYDSTRPPL